MSLEATENPSFVPVVAAVIGRANGDVLLAQRLPGGPHGDQWEFPGGKVEAEETPREALRREIREELGTEVVVGEEVCTVSHRYPHISIRMTVFACTMVGDTPRPLHCQAIAWVPVRGLNAYPMPAADVPVAQALAERADSRRRA